MSALDDSETGTSQSDEERIEQYEPDHPWERMPGESSKAHAKFCAYRDLGPQRSLAKLRRLHACEEGWSRPTLHELSERWHWQARASAWDDEQDKMRRQAQAEAISEMAQRQAKDGADMQRLARGAMARWVKQNPETGQLVLARDLSPSEAARLYLTGFQVERLARGEPTVVSEERLGAEVEYDEERITAGIAYALEQATVEERGVGGGRAQDCLPPPAAADADAVDGGPAVDSGQAEPGSAAEIEPDPAQAGE